jgi:hypothetical protein
VQERGAGLTPQQRLLHGLAQARHLAVSPKALAGHREGRRRLDAGRGIME